MKHNSDIQRFRPSVFVIVKIMLLVSYVILSSIFLTIANEITGALTAEYDAAELVYNNNLNKVREWNYNRALEEARSKIDKNVEVRPPMEEPDKWTTVTGPFLERNFIWITIVIIFDAFTVFLWYRTFRGLFPRIRISAPGQSKPHGYTLSIIPLETTPTKPQRLHPLTIVRGWLNTWCRIELTDRPVIVIALVRGSFWPSANKILGRITHYYDYVTIRGKNLFYNEDIDLLEAEHARLPEITVNTDEFDYEITEMLDEIKILSDKSYQTSTRHMIGTYRNEEIDRQVTRQSYGKYK